MFEVFLDLWMILQLLAENIGKDFAKDEVAQFWKCWFSAQQCYMQLQNYLMHAGDSEEASTTKSQRKATG